MEGGRSGRHPFIHSNVSSSATLARPNFNVTTVAGNASGNVIANLYSRECWVVDTDACPSKTRFVGIDQSPAESLIDADGKAILSTLSLDNRRKLSPQP
jgi:hypothetical protein